MCVCVCVCVCVSRRMYVSVSECYFLKLNVIFLHWHGTKGVSKPAIQEQQPKKKNVFGAKDRARPHGNVGYVCVCVCGRLNLVWSTSPRRIKVR